MAQGPVIKSPHGPLSQKNQTPLRVKAQPVDWEEWATGDTR